MPKVSLQELRCALERVSSWIHSDAQDADTVARDADMVDSGLIAQATRMSVEYFAQIVPGKAVELRVPPWIAVQVLSGGEHRRGVPPHVIEMDAHTWLQLFMGIIDYSQGVEAGRIEVSGVKCELIAPYLPVKL